MTFRNAWELTRKVCRDAFTERDGASYCAGRFMGVGAAVATVHKFMVVSTAPDYVGFGTCIAAIIAAIAAKNFSEKE